VSLLAEGENVKKWHEEVKEIENYGDIFVVRGSQVGTFGGECY